MLLVIYNRFAEAASVGTSVMACLGVILVFAFAQYIPIGNYNYISPYSHEALHGLAFSIFAVVLLSAWVRRPRLRCAMGAGFFTGLVFLTKPDTFAALILCVTSAFILFYLIHRQVRLIFKSGVVFSLAASMPLIGFFLFFMRVENWRESLRSICFGWVPLFHPAIAANAFYRWSSGLDQPAFHLAEMMRFSIILVAIIAFYALGFRFSARWQLRRGHSQWAFWLLLMVPALVLALRFNWVLCGGVLPLLCLSSVLLIAWNYRKLSAEKDAAFPLLWSIFGLALLAKLGLFVRIWQYGFALAMPAFVSAIYLLLWLLPKLFSEKLHVPPLPFRFLTSLVLLIGFASLANISQALYDMKHLAIGTGGDRIMTYGPHINPGEGMKSALNWIEKNVPPDATLAVIPEGVTLNYLSRRVNPTPCLFWDPNVMALFGQKEMTTAFEKAAPDYICIVERETDDLGVGYFGHSPGYGEDVMRWIEQNYEQAVLIGNEPLTDGRFGVKILKRMADYNKLTETK